MLPLKPLGGMDGGEDDSVFVLLFPVHTVEQNFGKEEIKIDALPVLADEQGAIGSSTSDSERAMITEEAQEVLTLIYSFSDNQDLEKALESGRRYLEQYAKTSGIQSWIVE